MTSKPATVTKRVEDLGPAIQDLLRKASTAASAEDIELLSKVTVRQMSSIYDQLSAGMSADEILENLKAGARLSLQSLRDYADAKARAQLGPRRPPGETWAERRKKALAAGLLTETKAQQPLEEVLAEKKKETLNIFKQLEAQQKLDEETAKALANEREVEVKRKLDVRKAARDARLRAGGVDYSSDEDKAVESEVAAAAAVTAAAASGDSGAVAAAFSAKRIAGEAVVRKPRAKGGVLEGTEKESEVWGEGVGTVAQQSAAAVQWSRDLRAETLATKTLSQQCEEEKRRRTEDEEVLGLDGADLITAAEAREKDVQSALLRLRDMQREEAKAAPGGEGSVAMSHKDHVRFMNMARRADMVSRLPRAVQKEAADAARVQDAANGFSPVEVEKRAMERAAHLDMALNRTEQLREMELAAWADAALHSEGGPAAALAAEAAADAQNSAWSQAELVHRETERLAAIDAAKARQADEAEKPAAVPMDVWRAAARRGDVVARKPRAAREAAETLAAEKDVAAGLSAAEIGAAAAARELHVELAEKRLEVCAAKPVSIQASHLVRLPRGEQLDVLARLRDGDIADGVPAAEVRERGEERRKEIEMARTRAVDEEAERAAGGDVAQCRLASIKADRLVRAPISRQVAAEDAAAAADLAAGMSPDAAAAAAAERQRHAEMAAARHVPTEVEQAKAADEFLSLSPADRRARERKQRAADTRARGADEARNAAAQRARHRVMAVLRRIDARKAGVAPADAPAWKDSAIAADLLAASFPEAQARDAELARLKSEDEAVLGPSAAAAADAKRREHTQLAVARKPKAPLTKNAVRAAAAARMPRKKQLAEEARAEREDEENGLSPAAQRAEAIDRKRELEAAMRRAREEKVEESNVRGDVDAWRENAMAADRLVLLPPAQQAEEEKRAAEVDKELGLPADEVAERAAERRTHIEHAKKRLVMAAERLVRMPTEVRESELKRAAEDDAAAGLPADEQAHRAAMRDELMKKAEARVAAQGVRMARMAPPQLEEEEKRLQQIDEACGIPPDERAARVEHRKAAAAAATKAGLHTKDKSPDELELDREAALDEARARGDAVQLALPPTLEAEFARRADDIVRLPAAQQRVEMAKDAAADAKIPGITAPELAAREAERGRHIEMARLRKDDEDLQDDIKSPAQQAAFREAARRADVNARKPPKVQAAEEAAQRAADEAVDKVSAAEKAAERGFHRELAAERAKKCPFTTWTSKCAALVTLPPAVAEEEERKEAAADAAGGLDPAEMAVEKARRAVGVEQAKKRHEDELRAAGQINLQAPGGPERLAEWRQNAIRADRLVRCTPAVMEEEEARVLVDDEACGRTPEECAARADDRAKHLKLARVRAGDKAGEGEEGELLEAMQRFEESGRRAQAAAAADAALEKEAEALGITAGEVELMLEEEYGRVKSERAAAALVEAPPPMKSTHKGVVLLRPGAAAAAAPPPEEETAEEKAARLAKAEAEWNAAAKSGELAAADAAAAEGDAPIGGEEETDLGAGLAAMRSGGADEEAHFETPEEAAGGAEAAPAGEEEEASAPPAPGDPYKLNIDDVPDAGYLKAHFVVDKYNPNTRGLLSLTKQKRVWVCDFFDAKFSTADPGGKAKKEHPTNRLLQLEKNIMEPRRLRMMFFDANHSYELVFASSDDRERFFECASSLRPAIRVWCPDLVREGNDSNIVQISGVTEADVAATVGVDGESVPIMARIGDEHGKVAKVNASKRSTEKVNVWCGTWNMAGARPPREGDAAYADLEMWMPKDRFDLYCVCVQGATWRRDEAEFFDYVMDYLGPNYLQLASMSLWDTCMAVLVKKKCLVKCTNVEGGTQATSNVSALGQVGGLAISLRFGETALAFVGVALGGKSDRQRSRTSVLQEVFDGLRVGIKDMDITGGYFDHVFVLGDLASKVDGTAEDVAAAIESEEYDQILATDHIRGTIAAGTVLEGFTEDEVLFKPTFPMVKGSGDYDTGKGIVPHYPDRVLVKSMPGQVCRCDLYVSADEVKLSTHTPVYAAFAVHCQRPFASIFMTPADPVSIVLHSCSLSGSSLPAMARPQLMVRGLFCDGPALSRPLKGQSSCPSWSSADLPRIHAHSSNPEYLATQRLFLIVRDYAAKDSPAAFRGAAWVPVGDLADGADHVFEVPVEYHSKANGGGMMRVVVQQVPRE